jgi:DNA-binding NarL/FixJ family response regulator
LGDILIEVVTLQVDMEVAGSGGLEELASALEHDAVDVAILGVRDGELDSTARAQQLLAAHPELKVVTIPDSGRWGAVLALHKIEITEPSPQMLLQVIRSALQGVTWTVTTSVN